MTIEVAGFGAPCVFVREAADVDSRLEVCLFVASGVAAMTSQEKLGGVVCVSVR